MRKVLTCILALVIIIFLIPILLTSTFESRRTATKPKEEQENTIIDTTPYQYQNYQTVKLLHTKTNEIEELPLDEYLLGVVSAEMPANFEIEALKAQAVVARTYTIYLIVHNPNKHEGASICDDSGCCQAWISKEDRLAKWEENLRESNWQKISDAVYSTKGKMITYQGEAIDAFFHSNSGGKTEVPVNVWGGSGFPYLQSVETAGEDAYTQYASDVTLSKDTFANKIKEKHADLIIDWNNPECIKVLEYTEGNRIKTLQVGNVNLSGVEVRTILGLKSANFEVKIENDSVHFSVKGYGHGVGMSQTGADSLAKQGQNYINIIKHFYTGVEVQDM